MTAKIPAWLSYALAEVGILGTWLISILTPSGADFSTLVQTGPLKALVLLEVAWLIVCALHWRTTGDPTPVPPMIAATTELIQGEHLATETHIQALEALVHDVCNRIMGELRRQQPQPDAPPAPPPPPAPTLETFHTGEAGTAAERPIFLQQPA